MFWYRVKDLHLAKRSTVEGEAEFEQAQRLIQRENHAVEIPLDTCQALYGSIFPIGNPHEKEVEFLCR